MKKEDGTWMSPPPTYPLIQSERLENNLQTFINVTENIDTLEFGTVYTVGEFAKSFLGPESNKIASI